MNKKIALALALACGGLFLACGSTSSGNAAPGNGNCSPPAGQAPACVDCVESACSSQFSAYCSSDCSTNPSSQTCQSAAQSIGQCIGTSCASQCNSGQQGAGGSNGQGAGGSNGQGPGGSTGAGGSVMPTGSCATLQACCVMLPGGEQDGCTHVANLGNDGACAQLMPTYASMCMTGPGVHSACYIASSFVCISTPVTAGIKPTYDMTCTQSEGGTAGDTCPSANLIGCCTNAGGGEQCAYTGDTSGFDEAKCTSQSGTWSTTP